ncbi:MAG: dihydroneopterin aldolase [Candidatus Chlorobium antarcticum]|nr:dihydroneopterin aldolase [Candidatus Chlorobium antarcticum]
MPNRNSSCVRLSNMVFYAHHGVLKEEHRVGAKYEVDVELTFDFTGAAQHDDLTRTVDYGAVYSHIRKALTMKKYFLIEAASFEIANDLLRDFEIVDQVSVRVRKRNPPVDGICDYAEADFTVARS